MTNHDRLKDLDQRIQAILQDYKHESVQDVYQRISDLDQVRKQLEAQVNDHAFIPRRKRLLPSLDNAA